MGSFTSNFTAILVICADVRYPCGIAFAISCAPVQFVSCARIAAFGVTSTLPWQGWSRV